MPHARCKLLRTYRAKAVVLLLHGIAVHKGVFNADKRDALVRLCHKGIAVVSILEVRARLYDETVTILLYINPTRVGMKPAIDALKRVFDLPCLLLVVILHRSRFQLLVQNRQSLSQTLHITLMKHFTLFLHTVLFSKKKTAASRRTRRHEHNNTTKNNQSFHPQRFNCPYSAQ